MRFTIAGLLIASTLWAACGDDEENDAQTYSYSIAPKSGNTSLSGTAEITQEGGQVTLSVSVEGLEPGDYGVHVHETGDCSADDASSAGGHWNPEMHDHGAPGAGSHLGDLGNITVGADGKGTLSMRKGPWTLGDGSDTDLFGRAVVVHAMPDDLTTQPSGASGDRIGCAVLAAP